MKNKQISLIFAVGVLLSLSTFLMHSFSEDVQNAKKQAVRQILVARLQGFQERQLIRQENNGIDSNGNTDLHDLADNCDMFIINSASDVDINPFLKNSNGQTAGNIVDQKLSKFTRGSKEYDTCTAIRSIITLLEVDSIQDGGDIHQHDNSSKLVGI